MTLLNEKIFFFDTGLEGNLKKKFRKIKYKKCI
jgi:hypothetical protein